jgi:hypothetical protein
MGFANAQPILRERTAARFGAAADAGGTRMAPLRPLAREIEFRPWAPSLKIFKRVRALRKGGTSTPQKVGHLCSRFYLLSSKCIAACANRCWSAWVVYFSASLSVSQPKIAISWCAVAPLFAAMVAPALRSPCAEHSGKPA